MSVTQLECGCRPASIVEYPRSGGLCDEATAMWLTHTRALLRHDVAATHEAWVRLNEHWDRP